MSEKKPEITIRYVYSDRVEVYQGVLKGEKKLVKTETPEEHAAWRKKQGVPNA